MTHSFPTPASSDIRIDPQTSCWGQHAKTFDYGRDGRVRSIGLRHTRVGSRWNKLFQTHRGYRKSQANSSRPADGDRRHPVRPEWNSESASHDYRGKNLHHPPPRSQCKQTTK